MAYWEALFKQLTDWMDSGIVPKPHPHDRVVELGDQELNSGISGAPLFKFIKRLNPAFSESELSSRFPVRSDSRLYATEIWKRAGMEYLSYDITEAPDSTVFDLNFGSVPQKDLGSAKIVTNFGTSEHIANQLNVFRVAHDLMMVGGVSIHNVPFTGWLNHGLLNYHPKFFFSLIVNNRYRLKYVEYMAPTQYATHGPDHDIFDGDSLPQRENVPGSDAWNSIHLASGLMTLVIERRFPDPFVPPVDFAKGYFGDFPGGDLSALVGLDDLPHSAWADAYRRKVTPSQSVVSS